MISLRFSMILYAVRLYDAHFVFHFSFMNLILVQSYIDTVFVISFFEIMLINV